MPINRGPFDALVDDDGSGTKGSMWNKTAIKDVLLDPIDAVLGVSGIGGPGGAFRGVRLRTHPDHDAAGAVVLLQQADQIVFEDGSHMAITTPLAANRFAVGAGGLMPGHSWLENTWYDIHVLKEGGSASLVLAQSAYMAGGLAQQTAGAATCPFRSVATHTMIAQAFTPAYAAPVIAVDVVMGRVGTLTGYVWLTIETDAAGFPSGTVVAYSNKITASYISGPGVLRFVFTYPPALAAFTVYHLVFHSDTPISASNYLTVAGTATDVPGMYAETYNGTTWGFGAGACADLTFVFTAGPNTVPLNAPAGATSCKVGQVYSATGGVMRPMWAQDRVVSQQGIAVMTTTSATPQLANLAPVIPYGNVLVRARLLSNVTGDVVGFAPVPDGYGGNAGLDVISPYMASTMSGPNATLPSENMPTSLQGGYVWRVVGTGNCTVIVYGYQW